MSDDLYTGSAFDEQIRRDKKQTNEKQSFHKSQYPFFCTQEEFFMSNLDLRRISHREVIFLQSLASDIQYKKGC